MRKVRSRGHARQLLVALPAAKYKRNVIRRDKTKGCTFTSKFYLKLHPKRTPSPLLLSKTVFTMYCPCFIAPPHLLRAIANSVENSDEVRKAAQACLDSHERMTTLRKDRFATLCQPHGAHGEAPALRASPFIPQVVLKKLSEAKNVDEDTRARAKRDLEHVQQLMAAVKSNNSPLRGHDELMLT